MESLKRKRTQFRKNFTRAADALEEAFRKHKDEQELTTSVEGTFLILSDYAEELFDCEINLRDLWCESEVFDETAFEHDQDKAATYKARWSMLKAKFQRLSQSKKDSDDASSLQSAKSTMKHLPERKVKMPKLEITKFNGEVKKWLLFWGQFVKVDEDPDISDSDKFQYLLQSMEPHSSARQLIESYPPCGKNYNKALDALKSRFARDDILIETYVRGLLALMQENGQQPSDSKDLPALYDSLQTHLQALDTLGVTKDKYASILFPMVESALPEDVLRAWNRNRFDSTTNADLSKLVDFLRLEVESEERIQLAHQQSSGAINKATSKSNPKEPTCWFVAETKPENHKNTSSFCIEKGVNLLEQIPLLLIRTATGELVRPAQRLHPPEISSADNMERINRPHTRRDVTPTGQDVTDKSSDSNTTLQKILPHGPDESYDSQLSLRTLDDCFSNMLHN